MSLAPQLQLERLVVLAAPDRRDVVRDDSLRALVPRVLDENGRGRRCARLTGERRKRIVGRPGGVYDLVRAQPRRPVDLVVQLGGRVLGEAWHHDVTSTLLFCAGTATTRAVSTTITVLETTSDATVRFAADTTMTRCVGVTTSIVRAIAVPCPCACATVVPKLTVVAFAAPDPAATPSAPALV